MDVQALDSVVTVLPPGGSTQSQSRADNSNVLAATAPAAAAPARASSSVSAAQPLLTKSNATDTAPAATGHVAYKLIASPVQTVIVFTNSQGVEVGQFPPQQLVALVKFDHDHASGSHVDRDV